MTKPEARVSRQNKGEPSLAEQHAALEKLRELVRQIEADRADRNAGSEQASRHKHKASFKGAFILPHKKPSPRKRTHTSARQRRLG